MDVRRGHQAPRSSGFPDFPTSCQPKTRPTECPMTKEPIIISAKDDLGLFGVVTVGAIIFAFVCVFLRVSAYFSWLTGPVIALIVGGGLLAFLCFVGLTLVRFFSPHRLILDSQHLELRRGNSF